MLGHEVRGAKPSTSKSRAHRVRRFQSCLPLIKVLVVLFLSHPGTVRLSTRIKSLVEVRLTATTEGSASFALSRFPRFSQFRNDTRLTHFRLPARLTEVNPFPLVRLRSLSPEVTPLSSQPTTPLTERGSGKFPAFAHAFNCSTVRLLPYWR